MIKFALAKEQRLHFERQQILELEGILPPLQIQQIKEKIDHLLSYSETSQVNWKKPFSAERHYNEGRDLWRRDPLVRKLVTDKGLAKIASELLGGKFLRLAYDQLLPGLIPSESMLANSVYMPLLTKTANLEEISCIRGAMAGVCICLRSAVSIEPCLEQKNSPFSKHEGNIVFFSAEKQIDFSELKKCPQQEFLLIVYASRTTLYAPNEADAHQHDFKKLGYVFGDRLNDEINPVLCRI